MKTSILSSESDRIAEPSTVDQGAYVGALEIVAHDMRGPLANLSILIEGMARNSQSGALDRVVANVQSAERVMQKLDEMLHAVLERARINGDPLSFIPQKVDLVEIIEQAAALNLPLAQSRWVRLHTICATPLEVTGDRQLLFELVDNLITNAVKYTRPGGLVVCEAAPARDGGIVVRISDEGPGFTDADRKQAFQPFKRLSAKSGTEKQSMGLGLWIARLIAKRHGGSIIAENRPDGEGAVFSLRLPGATKKQERTDTAEH